MSGEPRSVVVVVDRVSPYTLPVVTGVRSVLEQAGLPLLVHVNDYFAQGVPRSLAHRLRSGAFRGMVSLPLSTPEVHQELEQLLGAHPELPVVTLSGGPGGPSGVLVDNRSGMRALMRHLLDEQRVRRICLVRGVPHHPDSIEREAVVRQELAARGLELPEELVIEAIFDREHAYHGVAALLNDGACFDAVVALNDHSAVGAMDAVLDHGLRVPQDVLITGFDDDASLRARCPLTTVDQDLRRQGATAATMLLARLDGHLGTEQVAVPTRLVIRRSSLRSGAVAARDTTVPDAPGTIRQDDDTLRAGSLLLLHQQQLDILDGVLGMNRSFMSCHTEQDVMQALATSLPRLDISHCFVVLHEPGTPGSPPTKRLALVYPSDEPGPGAEGTFQAAATLPRSMHSVLATGTLLMQSLALSGHELGYVLYRQPTLHDVTAEVIRMDLTRALDGVTRQRQLEDLVAERTGTLNAEVAVRRRAEAELSRVNAELSGLNAELRQTAELDGLTGLSNRRAFDAYLAQVWAEQRTAGGELSVIFIDVDYFKRYNDRYGHLRGDDALRAVAEALLRSCRSAADRVARFGGEEFVVVLPATAPAPARKVADRIRSALRDLAVPHEASPVAPLLTVSQCVATARPSRDGDPHTLLEAADRGLYRAKELGRDRIVVVEPTLHPGVIMRTPG